MAGPQAAGDAGGSPQHTPNQDGAEPYVWSRAEQLAALEKLREKFPSSAISKKPQVWCRPCLDAPSKHCQNHQKTRCSVCGQNVTAAHTDLDYVGHAEATARLLDVDPLWNWEPVAKDDRGLPLLDQFGGMWIRLTVCGMTRLGYGDAVGKKAGPHAIKEIIGDAIRNAGMRFGMALDLWSKTDIHAVSEPEPTLGQKILARLRESKVWASERGLRVMLQQAVDGGVADDVMEEADWRTPRELIEDRLEELGRIAEEQAARRQEAAATRPQAVAQVAAEHGVASTTVPQPAPAPTAAAPAAPARSPQAEVLDALGARVRQAWDSVPDLEKELAVAEDHGVLDTKVPGPDNRLYEVGALLRGRIDELRHYGQQGQQQPAGTYAAAGITGNQQSRQEVA